MSLFNVTDTTRCRNCCDEFANHDYIPDSLDAYVCPHLYSETHYGFFNGGDPRKFHPDYECCSENEIKRWKEACAEAEQLESKRSLPCPSGWERMPNGTVMHILRAPFGIGTYVIESETMFEADDWEDPNQMQFEFDE
jgi:hypothetical protein